MGFFKRLWGYTKTLFRVKTEAAMDPEIEIEQAIHEAKKQDQDLRNQLERSRRGRWSPGAASWSAQSEPRPGRIESGCLRREVRRVGSLRWLCDLRR